MRFRPCDAAATLVLLALSPMASAADPGSSAPRERIVEIRAAFAREDFDGAIALAERLAASAPLSPASRIWLGRALGQKALHSSLLTRIGWGKKCKKAFEEAVVLDPDDLDARFELMRYLVVAPGIAGGDRDRARAEVAEIARRSPGRGRVAEGTLGEGEKDFRAAEAAFRKAAETDGADPTAANALGGFLLRQKRPAEALAFWKTRVAADPTDLLARYGFARAAVASGTGLKEAAEGMRAYLAVPPLPEAPSWADARWRLAQVLEKLGMKAESIRELEEALRLVPGHSGAKKDLERLRKA